MSPMFTVCQDERRIKLRSDLVFATIVDASNEAQVAVRKSRRFMNVGSRRRFPDVLRQLL